MTTVAMQRELRAALRNAGEADFNAALQALSLKYMDDLPTFARFLEAIQESDGDLSLITGRTHEPVGIRQFIEDDYFLGGQDSVWRGLKEAAVQIIEGGYIEALLTGAVGIGKTTLAQIVQAYHLYLLSLERSPQTRYGLMPNSSIRVAMVNITDRLAEKVTFGEFRQLLLSVPYFREHFPFPPDVKSEMQLPNNIYVIPAAANATKLLGMNIIGGIIDELNFMAKVEKSKQAIDGGEYDQAKVIYHKLVTRRKSRFQKQGRMPGCLCVVSSKGAPGDFTELRKNDVLDEDDGLTFVWEKAQWEVTPAERWSGVTFPVELGDERHDSRIIEHEDDARLGATVLHVPVELKADFRRQMEDSLRDLAGVCTPSARPYFGSRERIWGMADLFKKAKREPLFLHEEWDLEDGLPPINPKFKVLHPDRRRAAHVDLGLTSDRCGIAVGYVTSTKFIRLNKVGNHEDSVIEEMPIIAYDGLLTIRPPIGGEIDFSEVRAILYHLRDVVGLPLYRVTTDGFQSVDTRQILRKKGFRPGYQSVDGKESVPVYRALRSSVARGHIMAPEHSITFNELARLEHDKKKDVIDHPANGSKDTADAMAGVFATLSKTRSSWRSTVQPVATAGVDGRPVELTQEQKAINAELARRTARRRGSDRPQSVRRR